MYEMWCLFYFHSVSQVCYLHGVNISHVCINSFSAYNSANMKVNRHLGCQFYDTQCISCYWPYKCMFADVIHSFIHSFIHFHQTTYTFVDEVSCRVTYTTVGSSRIIGGFHSRKDIVVCNRCHLYTWTNVLGHRWSLWDGISLPTEWLNYLSTLLAASIPDCTVLVVNYWNRPVAVWDTSQNSRQPSVLCNRLFTICFFSATEKHYQVIDSEFLTSGFKIRK